MSESRRDEADIVIIGAGAAGLATAIFSGEADVDRKLRIVLLESAKKPGAKILISGGGRCNVTHKTVEASDYYGHKNIIRNILRSFDVKKTRDWFHSLGVELKEEETGKLFPTSDKARTVLDALLHRCSELGIELLCQWRVEKIKEGPLGWRVHGADHEIDTRRLIIATGGKSLPKSGSDGHGWTMLHELGHQLTDTWPALVPLTLESDHGHENLSGISHPVRVSIQVNNKIIDFIEGELLWTHTGISGPAPMNISRTWIRQQDLGEKPQLLLSFFPGEDSNSLDRWLLDQATETPQRSLFHAISSRIPRRVVEFIGIQSDLDLSCQLSQLQKSVRRRLVQQMTAFPLPVTGHRGWRLAEVTAGGIPLKEIHYQTMESKRFDGLYLTGEILDCEGRIGGFNFQWAWATGSIAGSCCVKSLTQQESEKSS